MAETQAAVQRTAPAQPPMVQLLEKLGPEIARALPEHLSPERMGRIALTALRLTPELAECTPASFLGSVMSCAQLGLEPNTPLGQAYLIPRNNKRRRRGEDGQWRDHWVKECTLLIGYQGMLDLADRSGRLSSVQAHVVHEGDTFSWELGLEPKLVHRPNTAQDRKLKPITHAYAVATRSDGGAVFTVLTRAEIEARRDRGGFNEKRASPWKSDFEAMAIKSAVRALWKWLPKSPEMARLGALEDASERGASPAGWDPTITDVLTQHDVPGVEDAELVDDGQEEAGAATPDSTSGADALEHDLGLGDDAAATTDDQETQA